MYCWPGRSPIPSPTCAFFSGISDTRHSVVRTSDAIETEFSRPQQTTLVGSITPASNRFSYVSVLALYPIPNSISATFDRTTSPSCPALSAICLIGDRSALCTINMPYLSSSSPESLCKSSSTLEALRSVVPPPGTTPISTAALVAFRASSYRSFLSLSSVSVAAPTLILAMPPPSLATLSSNFSLSNWEVEFSSSALMAATLSFTSS
mmetsp:Transcript_1368/g.2127  ORF Transcript_1368/g.2127 Transcript_1368/m.2127 type:complete len:208 (-) Transcript_1368:1268-1891(-)